MAGLPDGRNSVFTEPTLAGERAARRLINTITYESADFLRLRDIALTNPRNQRSLQQANDSRLNLEQAVNSLTILTDVPQTMIERVNDALKTGQEILSNFDPVTIATPTVSRLSIPSGEADSSQPQPTRVVSSGGINIAGTFQGNRPNTVLSITEEGIVRPNETSETPVSGSASESHQRTEITQTAPVRMPVDDSQSIGAIYSEGLNRTTSNQPHAGAVAHEVSLTPSELTLVTGVNQMDRQPQAQRSHVDRSMSCHNAQSAGQVPRNHVTLGGVSTARTGASSSTAMLPTNASCNNVTSGRVAASHVDATAPHAPMGDAVRPSNGQGQRTLNSAQVQIPMTYNAPLEKEKIIRRYEQLRQNLSSRMTQELAQVAEIAEQQQAATPMTHSQHGSRPPDPLTMHTQHAPPVIQQPQLNAHAQSFNPVTVPTSVHPHDRAQDQLHAQLHAHPSTQTMPQFQGSTPSFVQVNPQGQMGQVAASQPIATPSIHSANPYATVFSHQNSHTQIGRNPNQPGDVDIATSLLTVNLRQHSRELMIAGRPPKNAKFSGKSTQDFESHMATFDRVTNLEGITDEMRCLELRHWLEGSPLIILTQYDKIKEGNIAYQKIRNHLERVYGRKVFTAREMLDDLLQGSKLKDPIAIEEFILQMEKTYVDAVATHRDATFSTNDTFNAILRCKLPHFYADKWAAKKTLADDKYMEDKSQPYSLTFPFFISYCRQMNDTPKNKKAIHRDESKTTSSNPSTSSHGGAGKGNATKEAAKTVNLAATDATSHQRTMAKKDGKFKKYPQNAQQKQQTGASSTAQPARAPTPLLPEKKQVPGGLYCHACKASTHSTLKCREFGKMSYEDKKALVFKVKACFKCLETGHMSNKCPKTTKCETCASTKHNTHFHGYEK